MSTKYLANLSAIVFGCLSHLHQETNKTMTNKTYIRGDPTRQWAMASKPYQETNTTMVRDVANVKHYCKHPKKIGSGWVGPGPF